ncbi:MAG: J domain-containing protein [Armatimonadetes bacterium]|nr:J domain-containing protein [Armatimonadota bacterium]
MRKGEAARILGISPSATKSEVKRRFRELTKIHHPDTGGSEEKYRRILEAYETLVESAAPDEYLAFVELSVEDVICLCMGKTLPMTVDINEDTAIDFKLTVYDVLKTDEPILTYKDMTVNVKVQLPKEVHVNYDGHLPAIYVTRIVPMPFHDHEYSVLTLCDVVINLPQHVPWNIPILIRTPTDVQLFLKLIPEIALSTTLQQ